MSLECKDIMYVYTTINEWIRYTDTKAGLVLAFNGVMMAFVGSSLKDLILPRFGFADWLHGIFSILMLVFVTSVLVSAILAVNLIHARLAVGEARSHIYFAHIARRLEGQDYKTASMKYKEDLARLTKDEFDEEIRDQIFAVSVVCWRKFRMADRCVLALYSAVVSGIMIIIFCLLWRNP